MISPSSADVHTMSTLADICSHQARYRPEAIALVYEERETSYAQFDLRSTQLANALLAAGVARGERIAYLGKNSDRYFEILFGAAKAGIVTAPIGWRLVPREAAAILEDAEVRTLFVGPEGMAQARAAIDLLGRPFTVIAIDGEMDDRALNYDVWLEAIRAHDFELRPAPDDVVLQMYTSGTTGKPKGVMLSHENVLCKQHAAADAGLAWQTWLPDEISLIAMPVAHVGGSSWGIVSLFFGAKGVVAREFDPLQVLDFIERDRVSKIFMVPAALQIVVRQERARQVDYSRLRCILYGASPMPLSLLRECLDVFGCGFCQQYGMTETAGAVVYLAPEDHDPNGNEKMRSAGLPMPGVEIRIVDPSGLPVPPQGVGEIVIRSGSNMRGYWRMPEVTRATLDAEGWLRTGDAGYLDEAGYLFIKDRIKDLIISGAENIYPAEVEAAIFDHPGVAEVAVIGVPDDRWGEAVKAVIVPRPGAPADSADILAHARARIAAFKVPKSIDFVESLPRNHAGKILRRELRDAYWIGRDRPIN